MQNKKKQTNTKKVLKLKTKTGNQTTRNEEALEAFKLLEEQGIIFMEEPKERRASGRSTRQADTYVQELFTKGEIKVLDHAGDEGIANKSLFNVILDRLRYEHPTVRFEFNRDEWTIKLIKNMKRTIQH